MIDNKLRKTFRGKELELYKGNLVLTLIQRDIIIGILLGDASMECRLNKPVYAIKIEQCEKHEFYVNHLYEIFKDFVGMVPVIRDINASGQFKFRKSIWFRTYRHLAFKYYFELFYDINKGRLLKKLPNRIDKWLNARVLAYWFMDDGTGGLFSYRFNTQCFTYDEHCLLVSIFDTKFGIKTFIEKDHNKYRLVIKQESINVLINLIRPYILKGFLYKINEVENIKNVS